MRQADFNYTKVENLITKGLQLEIKLFTNVNPRLQLRLFISQNKGLFLRPRNLLFVKVWHIYLALPANHGNFLIYHIQYWAQESQWQTATKKQRKSKLS